MSKIVQREKIKIRAFFLANCFRPKCRGRRAHRARPSHGARCCARLPPGVVAAHDVRGRRGARAGAGAARRRRARAGRAALARRGVRVRVLAALLALAGATLAWLVATRGEGAGLGGCASSWRAAAPPRGEAARAARGRQDAHAARAARRRARAAAGASAARVAADVWRAEGLDGLWARGVAAGCRARSRATGLRLGLFSPLRAALPGGDGLGAALAAGALTGALGSALCNRSTSPRRERNGGRGRESSRRRAARALTPPRALRRYGSRAASGSTPTRPPRSSRARAPRARAACGAPRPSRSCAPARVGRAAHRVLAGETAAARRALGGAAATSPAAHALASVPAAVAYVLAAAPADAIRTRTLVYNEVRARARAAVRRARDLTHRLRRALADPERSARRARARERRWAGRSFLRNGSGVCRLLPMALFVLPLMANRACSWVARLR